MDPRKRFDELIGKRAHVQLTNCQGVDCTMEAVDLPPDLPDDTDLLGFRALMDKFMFRVRLDEGVTLGRENPADVQGCYLFPL